MKTCSDSDINYHFAVNNAFIFCWILESLSKIMVLYKIDSNLFKTERE